MHLRIDNKISFENVGNLPGIFSDYYFLKKKIYNLFFLADIFY